MKKNKSSRNNISFSFSLHWRSYYYMIIIWYYYHLYESMPNHGGGRDINGNAKEAAMFVAIHKHVIMTDCSLTWNSWNNVTFLFISRIMFVCLFIMVVSFLKILICTHTIISILLREKKFGPKDLLINIIYFKKNYFFLIFQKFFKTFKNI